MENRYLYKAKTTPKEKGEFNNVWVIGNLIVSNGKYYIHPVGNIVKVRNEIGRIIVMHEVIPDTICQCTGLKDKNGKLIWENDIVKHYNDGAHPENYCTGTVLWDENYAEFYRTSNEYGLSKPRINRDCIYEVIGNKFDNPELLEV